MRRKPDHQDMHDHLPSQPQKGEPDIARSARKGALWRPALETPEARQAAQQPEWPDAEALSRAELELSSLPPLVFAAESRRLRGELAKVCAGQAFVLQAGDCAESFDYALSRPRADSIRDKLKVFLQMALILTYSAGMPVVKIGRIAGQFAKPRSSATELRDGKALPAFRGHIVNDLEFSKAARTPDPQRLLEAYHHSASTLNFLRAFTKGGYASLEEVHTWNQQFVAESPAGKNYKKIAEEIDSALRGMKAWGVPDDIKQLRETDFYSSHEGLILNYEEALTRQDSISGNWYGCSAHMLWIGARTNNPNGLHAQFMRGINNPLGCKVSPETTPADILKLCETLNPKRIPGRLTLISRMGADKVTAGLIPLLEAVRDAGHPVVWQCDPMHGNTFTSAGGKKTRHLDVIMKEIDGYFKAHAQAGTWPGGIHLEITADNVTECLGGGEAIKDADLEKSYETLCDPRLNGSQSLELAFQIAEHLLDIK